MMPFRSIAFLWAGLFGLLLLSAQTAAAEGGKLVLDGNFVQGGLIQGAVAPGTVVSLDGRALRVDAQGNFVFGFHRDAPATALLSLRYPDGRKEERLLEVKGRDYDVQRIDGLPPKMVTPPASVLARIKAENAEIAKTRENDGETPYYLSGFIWPTQGRISGIYGSQRILNGKPRQPHYGIDIAAPAGTPVRAPAGGVVTLAEDDLYYTGGTIIIDHGHGLTSAFLHMQDVDVKLGQRVDQGAVIGTVGSTGRSTGAHLDWRINWFQARIDPALLVGPMPDLKTN